MSSHIRKARFDFRHTAAAEVETSTNYNITRIYDIATNTWSTGANMPDVHSFAAGGYVPATGKIYIISGYNTTFVDSAQPNTWAYDPVMDSWTDLTGSAPFPHPAGGMAPGVINNKLYIAGGRDAANQNINLNWEYDPLANAYTPKAEMPGTQPNLPGSAVALDVLWVFGGGNPFIGANTGASKATSASARDALRSRKAAFPWGVSKDAFVMGKKPLLPTTDNHTRFYDPSTDTWGSFSNMNEFRSSPSCAAIAGRMVLIDLSADFRVPNPRVFQQLNGFEHPSPELLSQFVYGLPEWNSAAIKGAKRIASPGCFATALQLALLPLRGLQIDFFAASAVTGSSGSGISPTFATHHPARANDFRAYKILTHHHTAEVEMAMAACNIDGTLGFVPHSGPFVRGIFATLQFGNGDGLHPSALPARAASAFDDCPFVRIVEGSPGVAAVAGTNFADVSVAANENTSAIMVALDNLGKGMAGQAVQAMNVALGLPETTALWQPARFPS